MPRKQKSKWPMHTDLIFVVHFLNPMITMKPNIIFHQNLKYQCFTRFSVILLYYFNFQNGIVHNKF